MNVVVIIVLMLAVSAMNIISGLIILILGNIPTIGLLKSLGATNGFVRRIFLVQAAFLVSKGMLIGNVLGLLLCAVQFFFRVIPLDPTSYYVSYVPIAWNVGAWVVLNVGTLALIMLILLLPASIVSRISPARVMRWE
jgi:lipoprotein-releasing system permease protein